MAASIWLRLWQRQQDGILRRGFTFSRFHSANTGLIVDDIRVHEQRFIRISDVIRIIFFFSTFNDVHDAYNHRILFAHPFAYRSIFGLTDVVDPMDLVDLVDLIRSFLHRVRYGTVPYLATTAFPCFKDTQGSPRTISAF